MNKNNLLKLALTLIVPLSICMGSWAQAVIFPQKKQPGVAKITQKSNSYQLASKVLKASFINTGAKLYFNGCSELGLQPDTELFKVLLGDGSTVAASRMKLEDVKIVTLGRGPICSNSFSPLRRQGLKKPVLPTAAPLYHLACRIEGRLSLPAHRNGYQGCPRPVYERYRGHELPGSQEQCLHRSRSGG